MYLVTVVLRKTEAACLSFKGFQSSTETTDTSAQTCRNSFTGSSAGKPQESQTSAESLCELALRDTDEETQLRQSSGETCWEGGRCGQNDVSQERMARQTHHPCRSGERCPLVHQRVIGSKPPVKEHARGIENILSQRG